MAMGPEEQNKSLLEIGGLILGVVEGEWAEIALDFANCDKVGAFKLKSTTPDGAVTYPKLPGEAITELEKLRSGMYREQTGTWFSLRYVITSDNRFHVDYEYDAEPDFGFEIDVNSFWRDLEEFPRSEDNIPVWLQEKLRRAAAGES